MRQWSDLPPELITDIAERLGLLEVMSCRSVCQSWNSAAFSTMSAKIEYALKYETWFLHYGYDSAGQCQLVTAESGNITMNLPQLDESTTCIGSYQGWLLMFKQGGSMFFFQPFSKTKIDLPKFPNPELTDHVAALSSLPTSADCTVCVISRSASNDDELELNLLHRGGCNDWIQHKLDVPRSSIGTIKFAAYSKAGDFFFTDHGDNVLKLSARSNQEISWKHHKVLYANDKSPGTFYFYNSKRFKKADMMNKLGLIDLHENVSFSVCGTQTERDGIDDFIYSETYEKITYHDEESKSLRKFKGVWINPAFYQVSPKEQSW